MAEGSVGSIAGSRGHNGPLIFGMQSCKGGVVAGFAARSVRLESVVRQMAYVSINGEGPRLH